MEKRYQVFISSTFEDLQEERQEVMHALLELDCIPSGMELFPAANEDQWTIIRRVIDDCDYYIVIVGGRYGSIAPDGQSYTEKEYHYAIDSGKPCLAFVHADPENLPSRKTDNTEEGRRQLGDFRAIVQQRLCKTWMTAADLGSVVSRSLIRLMKTTAATGWVRADEVSDEGANREIVALRRRIEELENQLVKFAIHAPQGTDVLAQGSDSFEIDYEHTDHFSRDHLVGSITTTWSDIFSRISTLMINESGEMSLRSAIGDMVVQQSDNSGLSGWVRPTQKCFGAIIVQLRALGLIVQSVKKRSLKDTGAYWTLTPYGDSVMTRLLAIKK